MKSVVIGTLALVLALLGVPRLLDAFGGPEWKNHVSEAGGYMVEMPGEARHQSQTFREGDVRLVLHIDAVEAPHGAFLASYNDYPPTLRSVPSEDVLAGARDGWLNSTGSTLVYEEAIELDGHPGMELHAEGRVQGKGDAVMFARVYLVDDRLFQLNFIGAPDKTPDEVIRHFLESFRLTR